MKGRSIFCCLALFSQSLAVPVAALAPTGSADWYYRMGGGRPVLNFGSGFDVHKGHFDASYEWHLDACGFERKESVRSQLNDLRDNLYALEQSVVESARSLLRVSAMSVLQRANPGLYDLVTRGILSASANFDAAVKNCRQLQQDMDAGRNPLQGWIQAAVHAEWAHARQAGKDPVAVQKEVERAPARRGVAWLGGKRAGGEGQPPVRVTADVVSAGYRQWTEMGRRARQETAAQEEVAPVLVEQLWASPEEAAEWTVTVLGETEIRLCPGCKPLQSRAGAGLHAEVHQGRDQAHRRLAALLQQRGRPDAQELEALGNPAMGLALSVGLLQGLREETPANRAILSERLATEIALAQALQKSLAARHLLRIGRRAPNVLGNRAALEEVERLLQGLDDEIENILFEQRVRREALTGTARIILERRRLRHAGAMLSSPPAPPLQVPAGEAAAPPSAAGPGAR